jgi:hypothetical protein
MRHFAAMVATGLPLCALAAVGVLAPSFSDVKVRMQDDTLVVDFVSTGQTPGAMVRFGFGAKASAVYGCSNGSAQRIVNKNRWMEGQFQVRSEGWVREVLSLDSPEPPMDFTCGSGKRKLLRIEYRDVKIYDLTHGQSQMVKGKFSKNLDVFR